MRSPYVFYFIEGRIKSMEDEVKFVKEKFKV
jgi:hypothetical protein